jgi:hypothetical protein
LPTSTWEDQEMGPSNWGKNAVVRTVFVYRIRLPESRGDSSGYRSLTMQQFDFLSYGLIMFYLFFLKKLSYFYLLLKIMTYDFIYLN